MHLIPPAQQPRHQQRQPGPEQAQSCLCHTLLIQAIGVCLKKPDPIPHQTQRVGKGQSGTKCCDLDHNQSDHNMQSNSTCSTTWASCCSCSGFVCFTACFWCFLSCWSFIGAEPSRQRQHCQHPLGRGFIILSSSPSHLRQEKWKALGHEVQGSRRVSLSPLWPHRMHAAEC